MQKIEFYKSNDAFWDNLIELAESRKGKGEIIEVINDTVQLHMFFGPASIYVTEKVAERIDAEL